MKIKDINDKASWCKILILCLEYLLAIMIVLDCNSIYANLVNDPVNYQKIAIVLSGGLVILLYIENKADFIKLCRNIALPVAFLLVWSIGLLLFMKIEDGYRGTYIKCFLIFLPISVILFKLYGNRGPKERFKLFLRFSDVVCLLSVMSLVLWLLIAVFQIVKPQDILQSRWGGVLDLETFKGLYFERHDQVEKLPFLGISIQRNIGLFPESPMFDIVLLVSLYTELFIRKPVNLKRIVLLTITIITTFGTLGIILAVLGMFLYGFTKLERRSYGVVLVGLVFLSVVILALVRNKSVNGFGSFRTHLDDFNSCIKAWLAAPLWGHGFGNLNAIKDYMNEFRIWNPGLTTSAGVVLAQGGIGLMTLFIIPFIIYLYLFFNKKSQKIGCWGIGMLGIFITSIFTYRFLLFWLLAVGYSYMGCNTTFDEMGTENEKIAELDS